MNIWTSSAEERFICDCEQEQGLSSAGPVRVDSREALDRVATWRAMTRVFLPRIELVVPELPENEVRERQARLDSLTDACGCGEGSAVALAGLGLYLAYALSIGPDLGAGGRPGALRSSCSWARRSAS